MNIKRIISHSSIPKKKEIVDAVTSFSKQRKIVFFFVASIFFASTISLFAKVAIQPFQNEIPVYGGTHKEGVIGTPRFVNPVLSFGTVDKDVESLVFAGLTKKTKDGSIVLDLAEDFSVSADNLVYTFTIDENARFHDGQPVTADDVVFTIQKIQDPEIKSPKQVFWGGVSVEKLDERRVRFVLKQPFIGFLENTSIGILPAHIWENIPVDEFVFSPFNTEPIGAGKYRIKNMRTSKGGGVDSYVLTVSRYYSGQKPFIKKINLQFFENEEEAIRALKGNTIQALADIRPESVDKIPASAEIYTATLHRMFGIFFNQKDPSPVQEKSVRQAIDLAIDREAVIDVTLNGFGKAIKSPLPTTLQTTNTQKNNLASDPKTANALLDQAGWVRESSGIRQKNGAALELTLTTAKIPELEKAAIEIQSQLSLVGIRVIIETLETNDLNQNIIRPRKFEMLLSGHLLNEEGDIFAFWHSSQTSDPGLNISSYKNKTVDKLLEQIIQTFDVDKRAELYGQFENEFFKDIPAIFVYSPELIYAVRGTIHNVELSPITNPSQRLLDMQEWYTETNYTFGQTSKN
jgi:peptide/nickel transport system substrate-binding protein